MTRNLVVTMIFLLAFIAYSLLMYEVGRFVGFSEGVDICTLLSDRFAL